MAGTQIAAYMTFNLASARRRSLWIVILLLASLFRPCRGATNDPRSEIQKVSGLSGIEESLLLRGEIISARGMQGDFSRGAYAESCYFVKASVTKVGGTLLHWDPSKYKEMDVDAYKNYRWPAAPDVFDRFRFSLSRKNDRQFIDWTLAAAKGEKGILHLRPTDQELLHRSIFGNVLAASGARENAVSLGWQQILQQQNATMARGGLANVPSYTSGTTTIRAVDEFKSVLKMTPGIEAHYSSLIHARPLFTDGATMADEVVPYAEQSQVDGHTSLCLGVLTALKSPETWQVLDCSYYTADTYFISVSLYQLWPWKDGTLVWQVDYTSAPFRPYLGGLDRSLASREMSKSSAQATRVFRREAEGSEH